MKRRVLALGIGLAVLTLLILGIRGQVAGEGGKTSRYKTVEIKTTQYVWELVSNRDGRVLCQIEVNHATRPSYDETIQLCGDQIFPAEATPTPFVTPIGSLTRTPVPFATARPASEGAPFDLAEFFAGVTWRFVKSQDLARTVQVPIPEMIVNLTVPPNQSPPYHVVIAAYEPVYGQNITGISGYIDGYSFRCDSARCEVPVRGDSLLEFWASSSFGDDSIHSQAAFRLVNNGTTIRLELDSIQPVAFFQDACAIAWNVSQTDVPAWAGLPASPEDLNTMKPYQFLAGKLIAAHYVDASDCPGGGLWSDGGANSCGLAKAGPAVIDWQNQFDVNIWQNGLELGVPPRVIKTLFEQESQFWPGNNLRMGYEYGLGQLNQTGADVALRWDNDLTASVCNGLLLDCSKIYGKLPTWAQATLRGGLMKTINAECPECAHGIDLQRANDSIPVFTRTLRANCYQVKFIVRSKTSVGVNYEDFWRFTLVSYHSGYSCLSEAFNYAAINGVQPFDWNHVSPFLGCSGAIQYADSFFDSMLNIDKSRLKMPESAQPAQLYIPSPTPTAAFTPTPTPLPAFSHVRVLVYVDSNNNNTAETSERVDEVKVMITFPDGQTQTKFTAQGEAQFDLTGRPVGEDITVTLPELYRTQKVRVMRDGEIPVIFRLEHPVVPPALP